MLMTITIVMKGKDRGVKPQGGEWCTVTWVLSTC